jgi:hypothetical protein
MTKQERDKVIQEIVKTLADAKANEWSVQDKGVLVAAVKLQLQQQKGQNNAR